MFRYLVILTCLLATTVANAATSNRTVKASWPDLSGKVHSLSQYRGKWVVVNYWATTCKPCQKEIPELSSFHTHHKDRDAVILGINFEDIPDTWLREFLKTTRISYPVLRSRPLTLTPFGPVTVLPTTFIISPDGTFMGRQVGTVTAAALEHYINIQTHHGKSKSQKKPVQKVKEKHLAQ